MPDSPIEILGARDRRRRWSSEQKLRIVAESSEPGTSVRAVAARHDVYPSLLHTWRRQARRGELVGQPGMQLLPIRVTGVTSRVTAAPDASSPAAPSGTIEISLADGSRVRVGNDVSLAALRRVISALRG